LSFKLNLSPITANARLLYGRHLTYDVVVSRKSDGRPTAAILIGYEQDVMRGGTVLAIDIGESFYDGYVRQSTHGVIFGLSCTLQDKVRDATREWFAPMLQGTSANCANRWIYSRHSNPGVRGDIGEGWLKVGYVERLIRCMLSLHGSWALI
jgi:hypothetical protein